MPQQQCPWCGHCGPRYSENTPTAERPRAHDDGSSCVCRHVNTANRLSALRHGGRYFCDRRNKWVCPWCGTDDPATESEIQLLEAESA